MLNRFTGCDAGTKAGFLNLIPTKRAATADEIAQTIAFLVGDKAKYLTGQSIIVDGSYSAT